MKTINQILEENCGSNRFRFHDIEGIERNQFDVLYAMECWKEENLNALRQAYSQYQFFLEGYKNGSATISEVTNAHSEFLKLLQ